MKIETQTEIEIPKPETEQQESMDDFKHRIAILMQGREGGEIYSIIANKITT